MPSESATSPTRKPPHLRRAMIALVVGVALITAVQALAPATDHQFANLGSVAIFICTLLFVLIPLHRHFATSGRSWAVPLGIVAVIALAVAMFRIDGYSGEMVPQIRFRFADDELELQTVTEAAPVNTKPDSSLPTVAVAESRGFLGNDRTGVIDHRGFSIPTDPSQVQTVWNHGIGQGWSSFAVAEGLAVTLEQRDDRECVTCYRLVDGELIWMESHSAFHQHTLGGVGPRSTPTIHQDRVYALGVTGKLWCLQLQTGRVHWSVDLLQLAGWDQAESELAITWGRASSPLIVDGMCVVPLGGPTTAPQRPRGLIALDAESGKQLWTAGEDQISYASPNVMTLGGQRQIVSVNEKTITGHRIDNGAVLWEFDWFGQSNSGANCAMAMAAGKDRFVVGKGYGGGSALVEVTANDDDTFSAEPVWTSSRILKTKFTHACIDGEIAYAISNGSLEAVRVDEAERLWSQPRRSRFGQGQILLVEDTIVAQAESGEVVLVAADQGEYRELLRLPALDAKTWNIPTVAGRYLLVRNDRQAICFMLPERTE